MIKKLQEFLNENRKPKKVLKRKGPKSRLIKESEEISSPHTDRKKLFYIDVPKPGSRGSGRIDILVNINSLGDADSLKFDKQEDTVFRDFQSAEQAFLSNGLDKLNTTHPPALEDCWEMYFKKLVPGSGTASTVEGEMMRAINKMAYRFYNDGDKCFQGYGIETCGACYAYLNSLGGFDYNGSDLRYKLENTLEGLIGAVDDDDYKYQLEELQTSVVLYIILQNGKYSPNTTDMYSYQKRAFDQFGDGKDAEDDYGMDDEDEDY